jgi:uncharacterized membrane protein
MSSLSMHVARTAGCLLLLACADNVLPTTPSTRGPGTASADRQQPAFVYETIDVPGALATSPQGIDPSGDVVGLYVDATNHTHGFLLQHGVFSTIDYIDPNTGAMADNTDARGISPGGEIVGAHWSDHGEITTVPAHGYRRATDGTFTPVHFVGHINEIPQRILADGTILGCRHDQNTMDTMRGIMIGRSDTTELTNLFASMINGATPDRRVVVGLYTNMMVMPSRGEAFVIADGDTTSFVYPGSTSSAAWDVNAQGDVVGVYRNATGGPHGFVRTQANRNADPQYGSIDVPGATQTRAFGINDRGDVVGLYVSGGVTHGFRARRVH